MSRRTESLPPLRRSHRWSAPGGVWSYDSWGGGRGRPVLLIPPVLFDRTTWWPVAADLRPHATVIALDLPGHGGSPARPRYRPDDLVDELAALVAHLGLRWAPVLVVHGAGAGLATRFAARYATHGMLALDPRPQLPTDRDAYLAHLEMEAVPEPYADLATAVTDSRLLAGYGIALSHRPAAGHPTRLAVHSRPPTAADRAALTGWRHKIYQVPGRFPQLTAVDRVVEDLLGLVR